MTKKKYHLVRWWSGGHPRGCPPVKLSLKGLITQVISCAISCVISCAICCAICRKSQVRFAVNCRCDLLQIAGAISSLLWKLHRTPNRICDLQQIAHKIARVISPLRLSYTGGHPQALMTCHGHVIKADAKILDGTISPGLKLLVYISH
jgi:hypothetical protein